MKKLALALLAAILSCNVAYAAQTSVSCAAGGYSDIIQFNTDKGAGTASFVLSVSGISGTYTVEVSNDAPRTTNALTKFVAADVPLVTHFASHDVLVGLSANAVGNLAYMTQYARLNCTSVGAGSVTLGVAQVY